MMTKITITRALAEIKLLQKRIDDKISNLMVVGYQQYGKMQDLYSHMEISAFEKQAKEELQSVEDLMNRITLIKTAIDKSNSTTIVKICGKEMTIQEALVEKKFIENKKDLLSKLKNLKDKANRGFQNCVERVNSEVDELRKSLVSENSNKETIEAVCSSTMELKYPKMVDPCDLTKRVESLENDIEDFENNIDYALSESNSVTYIEV